MFSLLPCRRCCLATVYRTPGRRHSRHCRAVRLQRGDIQFIQGYVLWHVIFRCTAVMMNMCLDSLIIICSRRAPSEEQGTAKVKGLNPCPAQLGERGRNTFRVRGLIPNAATQVSAQTLRIVVSWIKACTKYNISIFNT